MSEIKKYYSTREVAAYCDVNFKTVLSWIHKGDLQAQVLPSGVNRIHRQDLVNFLKKYGFEIPAHLKKKEKPKVLIVDDEENIINSIKRLIRNEGFEIAEATNGFEAGKRIFFFQPDLVLLDIRMPYLDGFDVLTEMKTYSDKEIKVIVISGHLDEAGKERCKELKADAGFDKPFDNDQLLQAIRNLMQIEKGAGDDNQNTN